MPGAFTPPPFSDHVRHSASSGTELRKTRTAPERCGASGHASRASGNASRLLRAACFVCSGCGSVMCCRSNHPSEFASSSLWLHKLVMVSLSACLSLATAPLLSL
eukprot:2974442-Pleurochrysis_carterae.AAC.4